MRVDPLFFIQPPSTWPASHIAIAAAAVLSTFALYACVTTLVLEIAPLPRIAPGGQLRRSRDVIDACTIAANLALTVAFVLHAAHWASHALADAPLTFVAAVLPVPALFVGYDLLYAPVHAAAHALPWLYAAVHKHHHRQVAPFRGVTDAINTHPLEYLFGTWLHLAVAAMYAAVFPLHAAALVAFVGGGAILAAANHTRTEVYIPYLFNSNEHDTHHRFSRHNYAQYTQLWDRLVGTFMPWTPPPVEAAVPRRAPPARAAPCLLPATAAALRDAPRVCVVTGGSGLVGARLVTMLIERGATRVVSLDVAPPTPVVRAAAPRGVTFLAADVCDERALTAAFAGADAVFHVAALVGPGFAREAYARVNIGGTAAVVAAARAARVRALVVTSSPTTRLSGTDERGTAIDDRVPLPRAAQLQEYSATKAEADVAARAASARDGAPGLRIATIAPHQVYGDEDRLFLPALLRAAASKRLRIFGPGNNAISWTHVDNAAHAHILAAAALLRGDRGVAGECFVVTDTGAEYLWDAIDAAVVGCGLPSLATRAHVPAPALYAAAHVAAVASLLCCPRKPAALSPFAVRMLLIDRWFDVTKIQRVLKYEPLVSFADAWPRAVLAARTRLIGEGVLAAAAVGAPQKHQSLSRQRAGSVGGAVRRRG